MSEMSVMCFTTFDILQKKRKDKVELRFNGTSLSNIEPDV